MRGEFDWHIHNLFLFHVLEWHYFNIQNTLQPMCPNIYCYIRCHIYKVTYLTALCLFCFKRILNFRKSHVHNVLFRMKAVFILAKFPIFFKFLANLNNLAGLSLSWSQNLETEFFINPYPVTTFFVLKILSALHVCYIYSGAFQTRLYHCSKQYEP